MLEPKDQHEFALWLTYVRARADQLTRQEAIVGFVSEPNTLSEYIPTQNARAVVVTRSFEPHEYRDKVKKFAGMVALVPTIYQDFTAHIGGSGWWYKREHNRVEFKQSNTPLAQFQSVGELRDIFETDTTRRMALKFEDPTSRRLLGWLKWMFQTAEQQAVTANQISPMRCLVAPAPRTTLDLRRSDELDQWVLECATKGNWDTAYITGITAPRGGEVSTTDDYNSENPTLLFSYDIRSISAEMLEELRAEGKVKGDRVEEIIESPRGSAEHYVKDMFDQSICIPFRPTIPFGTKKRVTGGEAIFRPIEKKAWTMEELRKHPDYEALCYMAALRSATFVNDDVMAVDQQFATSRSPVLSFIRMQETYAVQKIDCSVLGTHAALTFKGAGYAIDLHKISRKVEMQRTKMRRKALFIAKESAENTARAAFKVAAEVKAKVDNDATLAEQVLPGSIFSLKAAISAVTVFENMMKANPGQQGRIISDARVTIRKTFDLLSKVQSAAEFSAQLKTIIDSLGKDSEQGKDVHPVAKYKPQWKGYKVHRLNSPVKAPENVAARREAEAQTTFAREAAISEPALPAVLTIAETQTEFANEAIKSEPELVSGLTVVELQAEFARTQVELVPVEGTHETQNILHVDEPAAVQRQEAVLSETPA